MRRWKRLLRLMVLRAKRHFWADFEDPRESRFRRRLKKRSGKPDDDPLPSAVSPRFVICRDVLRRVFAEQMNLSNVWLTDDLIKNAVDLPNEEIMLEALEILGSCARPKYHQYESWNGTFGDLVRILEETVANDHIEPL